MNAQRRRVAVLRVESVERRELMSNSAFGFSYAQGNPARTAVTMASLQAEGLAGRAVPAADQLTFSALQGAGTPTPSEQARERFRAGFSGTTYHSAGRFSDQSGIQFIAGVGSANVFLHGDVSMAFATPVDPTQPIKGEAVLNDKNNNGNGQIGFVLVADRSSLDRFGRVTRFTFTSDPNIYGGIFFTTTTTNSAGTIRYNGNHAAVTFAAQLYTTGLTNPLKNSYLYSKKVR